MSELAGKVVVVTGGASGIGAAATRAFAAAGAKVAFTFVTSGEDARAIEADIARAGGSARAIEADLTTGGGVDAAFAAVAQAFGPVDILFANAGGLIQRSRCVDMDPDLFARSVDLNLTSTYLACQAALRIMEPRRTGVIVTMSSLAAFDGGGFGASHYAAMKGAIATYTRALAKEVGPLGIRVNGVAPGLIATRFHDTFNTPEGRRATVDKTPLRREGTPEDVADLVLFLASERASFITGEIVHVNGGLGLF